MDVSNAAVDAYNVVINGSLASSDVACDLDAPLHLGDIGVGSSSNTFSLKYSFPPAVTNFFTTVYASAQDSCGNFYTYPGPYPLNNAPTLGWTGEAGYESDGIDPDSAASGQYFEFRVKYTDADNDAPSSVYVAVDTDDDGAYAAYEQYGLNAVDPGDTTYTDGKLYTYTIARRGSVTARLTITSMPPTAPTTPPATPQRTIH